MKKWKALILSFLWILITSVFTFNASADMGPKPYTEVRITGITGEYVACFASKEANGPNFFFGSLDIPYQEYHPIQEYADEEGYRWITHYYVCDGETTLKFGYYPPNDFKIVVYVGDVFFSSTAPLQRYAFASYFEIQFLNETGEFAIIAKKYDYGNEIGNFFLRLSLTLLLEIGLLFLLRLATKRNFWIVLGTNIVTQVLLNVLLNVQYYFNGVLTAMFSLFGLEILVLLIELLVYSIFLKDKPKHRIILYTLLANAFSFGCGFLILLL